MNVEQIMKLVDEYAEERILATDEHSDGVDVALARASVVATLAALTEDAERYLFLRDNFASNSSNDEFEFSELAKLNAAGFDHKMDQEMEMYNATTGKPSN